MEAWEVWEGDVQKLLGLRSTISSGNKFYDPSDGVDDRHHSETDFALMVDAKCTSKPSYRLGYKMLNQWVEKARMFGKRFALPVRLLDGEADGITDYIVCPLNDYVELLESSREAEAEERRVEEEVPVFSEDELRTVKLFAESCKSPQWRVRLLDVLDKMETCKEKK